MTEEIEKSQLLKVCCTCSFWSSRYKGFCQRLEHGVGKFWMCEDWKAVADETAESHSDAPETAQAGALVG